MTQLPKIIDASMLTSMRACPLQFWRRYGLRRDPHAKSLDLNAGGAFSAGVEAYRIAFYVDHLPYALCEERATLATMLHWTGDNIFPPDEDTKNAYMAKSLDRMIYAIHAYFRVYRPHSDLLQPKPRNIPGSTGFEFSFSLPLDPEDGFPLHPSGEPFILAGRLDTLGTYDAIPCFSDEKTTKAIGPKWANQWAMRNQFQIYTWVLQTLGFDINHCLIRGIAIQKTQLRFIEHFQGFSKHVLAQCQHEMIRTLNTMIQMWESGDWEARIGDACTAYFGCDYRSICLAPPPAKNGLMSNMPENTWKPGEPHAAKPLLESLRRLQITRYNEMAKEHAVL